MARLIPLIPLDKNKHVLVDDEDFVRLNIHRWRYMSTGYAAKEDKVLDKISTVLLHHEIVWCPEGYEVDHINGNKLDNQKSNLRVCTRAQNQRNVGPTKRNKSGYKGVSWDKRNNLWVSRIKCGSTYKNLGRFKTAEEAAEAYKKQASLLHKAFAFHNRNKIEEV